MDSLGDILGTLIVIVIISIVLYLLLREVNCWYWKINARLKLMEDMNASLANISRKLDMLNSSDEETVKKVTEIQCPSCQKHIASDCKFCEFCGYNLA